MSVDDLTAALEAGTMRSPAAAAFLEAGERVTAGGDRPFLLSGDDVWRVAAGPLDIFAVRLDRGEPAGPRRHLLRVGVGGTAFGTGSRVGEGWGLLAVGSGDTELLRVRRSALEGESAGASERITILIASWTDALYGAMTRDQLPAVAVELAAGQPIEVGATTTFRVQGELLWVRRLAGRVRLLSLEGMNLDGGLVPVSRRAWLEAAEGSRLFAATSSDLSEAEIWSGLDRLHDLVRRHAEVSARSADDAARHRTRQKSGLARARLADACACLARAVSGARERRSAPACAGAAVERVEDPLVASFRHVAQALGVTLTLDAGAPLTSQRRDPLAPILRASRLRARRVALRADWWRVDAGPLLGFSAGERRPLALLRPKGCSTYVLLDPMDQSSRPIDAAVAETLEPFAVSLYRPLAPVALRGRDLLRFGLRGSLRDAGVVAFAIACAGLVGMVPAVATGLLFSTVIPGAQRSQLLQLTVVLLACAVVGGLLGLARSIALVRIEARAGAALQAAVWDRLLALPLGFFRRYTAGDLAVRAMAIDSMRQALSGATLGAVVGIVVAAGNFGLMFWYSPTLAGWATAMLAIVALVTMGGSWLQLGAQRSITENQSRLSGLVLQLLTSIAKLKVAAAEVAAFVLWARLFGEQRRLQHKARTMGNWLSAFQAIVPVASTLVVFWLALPLVTESRELTAGGFMAFLAAFSSCSVALVGSSTAFMAALNTLPLLEQAKPILEALPEVDVAKADPGVLTGDIEVQHAAFRYQADGPLILRDVSLHVRSGEFVALVGPSGSGKSTLLRLLLGFETLEGGAIYYDSQEIGGLDVQALRRQMGVVLQSGRLMSGDIFTNIAGASGATLDDAWTAARMAGLAEDIEAMPMGMHTVISEGGGTISGGQRQRLLIARAVVGRPRILLFDEATSALDNRTQALVSASLEALQATRIVVAHRLSTIVNADRIFVVEKGRLAQAGTYRELMAQPGPFAELARRQTA